MQGDKKTDPTARFYSENAPVYAAATDAPNIARLLPFLDRLEPGADILELGCGNGRDSAAMMARGFCVMPTDGTVELAQQAETRLGVPVPVLRFENLDVVTAFNGIWASACLLHVPRKDLPGILARIHRALRAGGVFYASFKAGQADGHDHLGRYYNYPSVEWLRTAYAAQRWAEVEIEESRGGGYDNLPTTWLHVLASKA